MLENILNHSKFPNSFGFFKNLQKYLKANGDDTAFVLNTPLVEQFSYDNAEKFFVILRQGYKLIFCNYNGDDESFKDYVDDFISDMGTLSGKFKYQEHIGRPKKWREEFIGKVKIDNEDIDLESLFAAHSLIAEKKRFGELLISLLTGNIQDLNNIGIVIPETPLENIRRKIVLFDVDQTQFIYTEVNKKTLSAQGLSGTGKTELLLHRLKDLYSADDESKIFFTCHNKALAKTLINRIPKFFDMMQTTKQIKWNERLWVSHAWGSYWDGNSGFYSYLCHYYGAPFSKYSSSVSYKIIFERLLNHIESLPRESQKPCFDYILIDESQDFPEVFFKLCEKVAAKKVYAAGDVFQKIYETNDEQPRHIDIILKRCYRTDPRTLMFSHNVGLGLNEDIRYNWLKSEEWKRMGYKYSKSGNRITVKRVPVNRPDGIDCATSVEIISPGDLKNIVRIIASLKKEYSDIRPEDIAVIMLDDSPEIYQKMDNIVAIIQQRLKTSVTRGHEIKEVRSGSIYLTNTNNIKGLEFPFVICYSNKIKNGIAYRNILYTMLTRSFLKTFLILEDDYKVEEFKNILSGINKDNKMTFKDVMPAEEERIKRNLMEFNEEDIVKSKDEILDEVFADIQLEDEQKKESIRKFMNSLDLLPDKKTIYKFVMNNLEFFK